MAQIDVAIDTMSFPDDTPAAQGDTVVWTNKMGRAHTVTADDGSFDSGQLARNESFSYTFTEAGVVPYHCENHSQMTGKVIVT